MRTNYLWSQTATENLSQYPFHFDDCEMRQVVLNVINNGDGVFRWEEKPLFACGCVEYSAWTMVGERFHHVKVRIKDSTICSIGPWHSEPCPIHPGFSDSTSTGYSEPE
jgi:hypothetical protein